MQKRRIDRQRYQAKKRRKTAIICGVVLVCFFFMCLIVYAALYRQMSKVPKDKVCEGIAVGQVDVSGMTAAEARAAIDRKADEYRAQELTFTAGEKRVTIALAELGFDIVDEEKLIQEAVRYGNDGSVWSRYFTIKKLKKEKKIFRPQYRLEKEQASSTLQQKVSGLLEGASDASIRRENGAFVITDEKEGVELDIEATLRETETFLNQKWNGTPGTLEVISKEHQAKVTRADLESIQDKLGTFSTYCGSGQSRVTNIVNGAKLIDGSVLMPGEEFSAGKKMQPFTADNGYVEAGAFENGEVVQSMAGGICQVSTTLYNAVINAELKVTSRQPHSMTVHYVKPSRDAAIAGDYKDLKFQNTSDSPVYIEGYVSNGNVVFSIYGKETRPKGRTLEFVSETVETREPKKKFTEQADAAIGSIRQTSGGKPGITAQLWKVVYENGKEVSREIFNKSVYNASTSKIAVGTASADPEYTGIVRAAIATQDEAKIRAAIEQVKAKAAAKQQQSTERPAEETTQQQQQPTQVPQPPQQQPAQPEG